MDDLSRDLASLYGPGGASRVEIPADVDDAVRAGIHARARQARATSPWRPRWRTAATWLAAASLFVVTAVVFTVLTGRRAPRALTPLPGVAADVDRSGNIDILDAFALARLLEGGSPGAAAPHDINGDGVVDRDDVDAIAMRAVALDGETS